MKIYNYDEKTGIYLGESEADPSPLEPGKYLIPRLATDIAPPDEVAAGYAAFFRGGAWEVEAVPAVDADLDGVQDAPQRFEPEADKPGFFRRILSAVGL